MIELTGTKDVQDFIQQNRLAVIFKAGICRQTEEAKRRLSPFFKKYPDIPAAKIDVVSNREASTTATGLAGKKHESPQILLFKDGKCIYTASHWRIEGLLLIDAIGL